jgi:hypothetical protein
MIWSILASIDTLAFWRWATISAGVFTIIAGIRTNALNDEEKAANDRVLNQLRLDAASATVKAEELKRDNLATQRLLEGEREARDALERSLSRRLSDEQQNAIVAVLKGQPPPTRIIAIAPTQNTDDAAALAWGLGQAFAKANWPIRRDPPSRFGEHLKGVLVMHWGSEPSPEARAVLEALRAAGIQSEFLVGGVDQADIAILIAPPR